MLRMCKNFVGDPLCLGKKIEHHIAPRIVSIMGLSRKTIGIGTKKIDMPTMEFEPKPPYHKSTSLPLRYGACQL
jgi:hypothetical protein